MVQLILMRTGSTEFDQQGRVQGTLDIPLSADGRQEVERMVGEVRDQPIDAIYFSPHQSAEETALALGNAFELKVKSLDKLTNLDLGLWQGMLVADVKAKQPTVYRQWQEQPEVVCPPRGETLGQAKQRVAPTLAKLLKKHKDDRVVVLVAPEPLSSVIRNVLCQEPWGDLWKTNSGPPRWRLLELPETAKTK
ncbi:MAG: histidine phosphatase family protein [Pirellulales bacterium]|nr:histidine phosphatase family protein [Pirellulales bacterium]